MSIIKLFPTDFGLTSYVLSTELNNGNSAAEMSASSSSSQHATINHCAFDTSLSNLRGKLTAKEIKDFQFASLDELHTALHSIQEQQIQRRSLQCLVRIQPFLRAMEQYGKVIEVFLNTNDILAFVWVCLNVTSLHHVPGLKSVGNYKLIVKNVKGPMKFILQV